MSKKEIVNALLDFSLGATVLAINNINIGVNNVLPFIPTQPTLSTTTINPTTLSTTTIPFSTTTVDPWPPMLMENNEIENSITTYVANTFYGLSLMLSGIGEFCKNRFVRFKNITSVINGVCLSASGLNMLLADKLTKNDSIIPLVAGIKQVKDIVLKENIQLQPLQSVLPFDQERARLINACDTETNRTIGSMDSLSLASENIIWDRSRPYQDTVMRL